MLSPPPSPPATSPPPAAPAGAVPNLRAVLGLSAPASPRLSVTDSPTLVRRKKAARAPDDDAFFEVPDPRTPAEPATDGALPARRAPLRMDAQDGPWSISVAEHPHTAHAYTLYIKTPTHNLTLTRTAAEVVELHNKLRDGYPQRALPALPLDGGALPAPTPKRKSAFLSTLSRLTSPASAKTARAARVPSTPASAADRERDPFAPLTNGASAAAPQPTATRLAAYLTTLANDQVLRTARPWRRFVRVRTDDLESVRVERAIKRVRSDLAAHASPKSPDAGPMTVVPEAPGLDEVHRLTWGEDDDSAMPEQAVQPEKRPVSRASARTSKAPADHAVPPAAAVTSAAAAEEEAPPSTSVDGLPRTEEDDTAPAPTSVPAPAPAPAPPQPAPVSSPSPDSQVARIPRSLSAEPAKAGARLSRLVVESSAAAAADTTTDTEAPSASETGDEADSTTDVVGAGTGTGAAKPRRRKSRRVRADKRPARKVVIDDFEMMRVLGKGCAGKVLLVRHKQTQDLYALKAITKRHVLAHQELQHTLTEQAVLKRMAAEGSDPFVVKLWWSFHDKDNLFLVLDFHPGGDLATQLARWGRLGRDRARFYAAEIVEGVEGLHAAGVIYRDLKPENVLIGGDGHIVLTDFGLSKEFPRRAVPAATAPTTPVGQLPPWMRAGGDLSGWPGQPVGQADTTSTFCGTAEYLAPEVIQGLPYSYEVDWWSFGTMLYEMLTGITPFWANNHADMYVRVLQDELQFPDDRTMDQDTKSLLRGLLQRNPGLRLCEPRIKKHPYFSMIDWTHVYYKRYIPPYIPPIDPANAGDVQNFDETFLDMKPVINDPAEEQDGDDATTDTDGQPTDTDGEAGTPLQSRSPSLVPAGDDVFDGYSFKGRHSVLLDDEDDSGGSGGSSGEDTEEEGAGAPPATAKPDVEAAAPVPEEVAEEEEPKTPEARPAALPDVLVEEKAPETAAVEPSAVHEPAPELKAELQSEAPVEETKPAEATKPAEEAKPALAVETTASKAPEDVPLPPDEAPFEVPPTVEAPVTPVSTRPTLPAAVVSEPAPVTAAKELAPVPAAKEAAPVPVAKELGPATGAKELVDESRESLDVVPPMAAKGTVRISARTGKPKREKSGVPALDRFLSEDENGNGTELEEDDWDIVEAVATEERNGARGNSLFARGVVDRYRLSVFRKGSTPQRAPHSLSGSANASFVSDAGAESPSPSAKQRRGRNPGLTFRRHPKEFLRGKSPPSVASSSASARVSAQTLHQSVSQALSTASGSTPGVLTPSPSLGASAAGSPSLRTKESTLSVATTPSMSSDVSADSSPGHDATVRSPEEAPKNKKVLKKYKEGAEKVLALFSSPR